jgi:hypothetical protein
MVAFLFLLNKKHKIRKLFFFKKTIREGIILANYFVSKEFKILLLFLQKIN